MMVLLRCRRVALLLMIGLIGVTLASCTPNANAEIISPELGAKLAAREAGSVIEIAPTPVPVRLADLSQEEILAGLPAEIIDVVATADPAQGQQLTLANGCIGCHSLDPNQQLTGPTWVNVGDIAANRLEGVGPALYLYQSITAPNSYVVRDYPAGIMPQIYSETLNPDQLAALIAFLLEQHE